MSYHKRYYQKNKALINRRSTAYYRARSEQNPKMNCPCNGKTFRAASILKHFKTKTHREWIDSSYGFSEIGL